MVAPPARAGRGLKHLMAECQCRVWRVAPPARVGASATAPTKGPGTLVPGPSVFYRFLGPSAQFERTRKNCVGTPLVMGEPSTAELLP